MVRTAPAVCPTWRSSYVSPDSRHRPQSSRVQHRCPGRARQYRAGRPRVFLAGDSARIINPPTDRWARRQNTAESKTPTTWPGCCGGGAPRPGWSRALLDIPITQCERHPIGLLSLYAVEAFARFGSSMGQGPEVPHLSTTGR
jgi:hypothetical protein